MTPDQLNFELSSGAIEPTLKSVHREAMLDLILAWANVDGALTQLIADITGASLQDAARKYGKLNAEIKLKEMANLFADYEQGKSVAKTIRRAKKRYARYAVPRNRIAHSKCVGYLRNEETYVVFAVTEQEGISGMAVEAVPLDEMRRAERFAIALSRWARINCSLLGQREEF